jgi:hypothetical protein
MITRLLPLQVLLAAVWLPANGELRPCTHFSTGSFIGQMKDFRRTFYLNARNKSFKKMKYPATWVYFFTAGILRWPLAGSQTAATL